MILDVKFCQWVNFQWFFPKRDLPISIFSKNDFAQIPTKKNDFTLKIAKKL
jgi:hypothetical protein